MHPMPRLDEWYENGWVQTPDVLEWLKGQTPEEWHLATCFTSLDGDQRVLAWVIDQPECELGTALNIFWKGAPVCPEQAEKPFPAIATAFVFQPL